MKLIASAICIVALCGVGLVAQESETHSKQKIEVKDGKKITARGCVERTPDGLILNDVSGDVNHSYVLVGADDLSKHVGHRVEITGKAADRGNGKVKIETERKGEDGREVKTKSESDGNLSMPLLGVQSIKMLSDHCEP